MTKQKLRLYDRFLGIALFYCNKFLDLSQGGDISKNKHHFISRHENVTAQNSLRVEPAQRFRGSEVNSLNELALYLAYKSWESGGLW